MWEAFLKDILQEKAKAVKVDSDLWEQVAVHIQRQSERRGSGRRKAIIGVLTFAILVISGAVYGSQAYDYWKIPRTAEQVRKSENLTQHLEQERKSVDQIIADNLHLDLSQYEYIDIDEIFKQNKNPLLPIVSEILDGQQIGDRKPSLFIDKINHGHGYIFEDKVELYVVYVLEKNQEGVWEISNVDKKQKH